MKPIHAKSFIALACAMSTTGCIPMIWAASSHGVHGSGRPAQETRRVVGDFSKVNEDGAVNVAIRVGDKTSVTVEGDDNIVPLVKTSVQDNTLYIETKKSIRPKQKLLVTITMPRLDEIQLDGAGNVTAKDVKSDALKVGLYGAGNIDISGTASSLTATLDGAGNITLTDLQVKNADVTVDGAGNLDLWATDSLKAALNGVGNIHYKGSPKVQKEVNGVGRITPG